jgi:hypothetical protein
MRFLVLKAVIITTAVFWDVISCDQIDTKSQSGMQTEAVHPEDGGSRLF